MRCYKILNNKKNLLITLGDSWTEGVGNYEPTALLDYQKNKISQQELYSISDKLRYFYKEAWPTFLSEKLDYDLINLGQGGDANSATAKKFICDFDENMEFDSSKYEKVTVLFSMLIGI